MSKSTCPTCKRRFKYLSRHWSDNKSHRISIEGEKMEILIGVLMGDGNIKTTEGNYPYLRANMANVEYLEWLDSRLGWLSNGIREIRTAEESAKQMRKSGFRPNANKDNYHDQYSVNTMCHPDLSVLEEWYSSGEKRFPKKLKLTPAILKHWYCCDGGLAWSTSNRKYNAESFISSVNEFDRIDYLQSLFNDIGLKTYLGDNRICMSQGETAKFLRYIGEPLPGFKYKWENRRPNIYKQLKKEAYEQDYESPQQTLENWTEK